MTELERQRMLAAITRSNNAYTGAANPTLANVGQQAVNAGTTSGMVSGYVDAAKAQSERENAEAMARSFKGQESNIASQRARAASLRGKGMPQARMVGEGRWATLTQPNWGEQLEGVTNQLVGGYLEGQARKDAEQLDVDVTEQAGLVLAAEEEIRLEGLALEASLAEQAQSNFEAGELAKITAATVENDRDVEAAKVAAGVSAGENSEAFNKLKMKRNDVAYYVPNEEGGVDILNMQQDGHGNYYSTSNELMPEAFVKDVLPGLTEVVYGSQNTSKPPTPKQLEEIEGRDTAMTQSLLTGDVITRLLGQPEQMMAASGPFYDPVKIATDYMAPIFGLEEEQATGMQMTNLTIEAAKPILDNLGINPTDADLKIAMEASPSRSNEPASMYRWYKDQWMPALIAKIKQYYPGDKGKKLAAQTQAEMMDAYEKGFAKYNKLKSDPIFSNVKNALSPEEAGWELVQ